MQGAPAQSNLGDRAGALSSLEKGRSLLAPFLDRPPAHIDVELRHLYLLRSLADVLRDQPARAQPLISEGIARAKALQGRYPDNEAVIEALALAYFSAAITAQGNDQLGLWTEANTIYEALVARAPDNAVHLRNLARTEKYIGSHHHNARRSDLARPYYERAIELDRQVQRLRPEDRRTTVDLAIDLGNLAALERLAVPPRLAAALELYRESLVLRERAVALDPADIWARQGVGFCLTMLSAVSRELGDFDAAAKYGRRSVDIHETLPPGELLVRRGEAWLALGRADRLAGRAKEACAALRRAEGFFLRASAAEGIERTVLGADTLTTVAEALAKCR